jgi:hypothetical protein
MSATCLTYMEAEYDAKVAGGAVPTMSLEPKPGVLLLNLGSYCLNNRVLTGPRQPRLLSLANLP